MGYTASDIRAISRLGREPDKWVPGGQPEIEEAESVAKAIQDSYTEEDWRYVLNTLSAPRAARKIAKRPPAERDYLLGLLDRRQRPEVESHLSLTV